jgi:hypothetical protein
MKVLLVNPPFPERALRCLKRLPANESEPNASSSVNALVILMRVILRLGIIDSARLEFWRYMRIVVTKRRKRLAQAVRLAIMGYHFRKLPAGRQPC